MWCLNLYLFYCLGWTRRDLQIIRRQNKILRDFRDAGTDEIKSEKLIELLEITFKNEDEPYLIQLFGWIRNKLKREPVDHGTK